MRKAEMMQEFNEKGRYTVTYCQYGDKRMKPTDIWTNHPEPNFKPPCKNGDKCHVSAPRGSKTGTQGLKNNLERSKIPKELCKYVVEISENLLNESWEEMNLKELKWKYDLLKKESYKNNWQNEFVNQEIKEIKNKIEKLENIK